MKQDAAQSRIKTFALATEQSIGGWILSNQAGLTIHLLPHGGLRAIRCGTTLINQVPGPPLEGGMNNIYLRAHTAAGMAFAPLIGPHSLSGFCPCGPDAARWSGTWRALRYVCTLQLHPAKPIWAWQIRVTGRTEGEEAVDLVYGQDIGLGDENAVRTNEAYTSQYLDHQIHRHDRIGFVLFTRQNQEQSGDAHPWLMQGCLPGATSFSTDGFQFFGRTFKATLLPSALYRARLPALRRQYEFAYAALQSPPAPVRGGEPLHVTFFASFEADHPGATSPEDFPRVDGVADEVRWFTARTVPEGRVSTPRTTAWFHRPQPFPSVDLTEGELQEWFGQAWSHVERDRDAVLSFFCGTSRHVVTRHKELLVERQHGHIIRSSATLVPDDGILCSTLYACGVFNSHVALGNTNFHKLLSVVRNPLNVLTSSGQRIFVEVPEGWQLLALPSAFEMGLSHGRWIYASEAMTLVICTWIVPEQHALALEIEVVRGGPRRFVITHELVLSDRDLDSGGDMTVDEERGSMVFKPSADGPSGACYPGLAFALATADAGALESMGDSLLREERWDDHAYPYAVLRTRKISAFRLALAGSLEGAGSALTLASACVRTASFEEDEARTAQDWNDLTGQSSLRREADDRLSKLNHILPWFAHNAMVHFLSPHGLEQFSGAAWGVRDVCQGPVEFLLALRRYEPVREILLRVFSQQYEEQGNWPQWFMFDAYRHVQQPHCHGDVIIWPLKALCDYIEAADDAAILDFEAPFTDRRTFEVTPHAATIFAHCEKLIARIEAECLPGTALLRYGDGDWDDTLQPADHAMRNQMVSSWTVALVYQTLERFLVVCRRCGRAAMIDRLAPLLTAMRADFFRHLVADDVVAGFALFHDEGRVTYLLHPSDDATGIHYRLLPMTRGVLSGLFSPEQANRHMELVREHLLSPDGVRLMDKPATYRGGLQRHFRRAETAAHFGREIGLHYVHAHLRYAEALARLGRGEELLRTLLVVNPIGIRESVPNAQPRQANAYFSSSDAVFTDRDEAGRRFDEVRAGRVEVSGGWRIYSSGPGLYVSLVIRYFLGIREQFDHVVFDPVFPPDLDGLSYDTVWDGKPVRFNFRVAARGYGPARIVVNGQDMPLLRREENPYRQGGALLARDDFAQALQDNNPNSVEIFCEER